ncbi:MULTISPECIES: hypothetical protein [Serratia]|uniref:hypothetical protein n=1 Tax=Serratia TaxID=613 RepID=UPI0006610C12|nr:hypothetical protein [Serratia sp. 506_PEND]
MNQLTIRDYIRQTIGNGEITHRQILEGYRQIKPEVRSDSVACQLSRMTENGELEKYRRGKSVYFIKANQIKHPSLSSRSSKLDHLLFSVHANAASFTTGASA